MKTEPKPLEPALTYRRVSTDKQHDSMELQEDSATKYAAWKDLSIPPENRYSDPFVSGGIALKKRKGGCALMHRLRQGLVKHLIITKSDRLGRNTRDWLETYETLEELGVTLHIVDQGGDSFSSNGPMGKMMLTMLSMFAEFEREMIRERTQKAMTRKFDNKSLTGKVPFGWDAAYHFADGHTHHTGHALHPDNEQAPLITAHGRITGIDTHPNLGEQAAIHHMHRLRQAGWSYIRIANELNSKNILTKTGRQWGCGSVSSVLASRQVRRLLEESVQTPAQTEIRQAA